MPQLNIAYVYAYVELKPAYVWAIYHLWLGELPGMSRWSTAYVWHSASVRQLSIGCHQLCSVTRASCKPALSPHSVPHQPGGTANETVACVIHRMDMQRAGPTGGGVEGGRRGKGEVRRRRRQRLVWCGVVWCGVVGAGLC